MLAAATPTWLALPPAMQTIVERPVEARRTFKGPSHNFRCCNEQLFLLYHFICFVIFSIHLSVNGDHQRSESDLVGRTDRQTNGRTVRTVSSQLSRTVVNCASTVTMCRKTARLQHGDTAIYWLHYLLGRRRPTVGQTAKLALEVFDRWRWRSVALMNRS